MSDQLAVLEQVVVGGDLSKLAPTDRLSYYKAVCESVGLNPLTRPLEYLHLSGKLVLYARKDATDQLRKINGVSITRLEREVVEGVYVVTAHAQIAAHPLAQMGSQMTREDQAVGAVPIEGLKGEARANAMMKAETKAKRRVTLSICGLGMLDETEVESIPGAKAVPVDPNTGELPRLEVMSDGEGVPHVGAADRTYPVPGEESREPLLQSIKAIQDRVGMKMKDRTEWWEKYVGGGTIDPRSVDVSVLQDLYAALKGQYGE